MGDVILTTPLLPLLNRAYPDVAVDVACDVRYVSLWRWNPYVRNVWPVSGASLTNSGALDELKLSMQASNGGHYDVVVDLQRNVRSRLLRTGLGNDYRLVAKYRAMKLALVWLKKFPRNPRHVVERYLDAMGDLLAGMDAVAPEVWTGVDRQAGAYGGSTLCSSNRIAIAFGARHATKRWPAERFAQLIAYLHSNMNMSCVLVGGPDDVADGDRIAGMANVKVEKAYGDRTILESARVLDSCRMIVSNDSGLMHLASARRLPVVAVFGSTVPALGFTPWGVPHVLVEKDLACRPCSHIGGKTCPLGHFRCMMDISVADVISAIHRLELVHVG